MATEARSHSSPAKFVAMFSTLLLVIGFLPRADGRNSTFTAWLAVRELGQDLPLDGIMPLRQRGLNGRRLHLESVPESSFVIEKCASIAGLVSAKRTALAHHDYTECINVFGALIAGHSEVSSCGADSDMIYAANILAETLDTNNDGSPDDASVVDQIRSFGTTQPKAILIVGCNQVHEEVEWSENETFYSHFQSTMSSQGWKHGVSG